MYQKVTCPAVLVGVNTTLDSAGLPGSDRNQLGFGQKNSLQLTELSILGSDKKIPISDRSTN